MQLSTAYFTISIRETAFVVYLWLFQKVSIFFQKRPMHVIAV